MTTEHPEINTASETMGLAIRTVYLSSRTR